MLIGGAPTSLKVLIDHLPKDKCDITVGCLNKEAYQFFNNLIDIKVINWSNPVTMFGKVITGHSNLNSINNVILFL